jgi:hypothetical protein
VSREGTAVDPTSSLFARVQIINIQDIHESTGSIQEEHVFPYFPIHLNAFAVLKIHIMAVSVITPRSLVGGY